MFLSIHASHVYIYILNIHFHQRKRLCNNYFGGKNISTCVCNEGKDHLAQFRAGKLPLHIETGRWADIQADERVCNICRTGNIEDQVHFLCVCPAFKSCHITLYESAHMSL